MKKIDYKKELKKIYNPRKGKISILNIPSMNFIQIKGKGHPNEKMFQQAAQTIFVLSYIIKFEIIRPKLNLDYKVMPLEVKWELDRKNKKFYWTMMIMQPPIITSKMFQEAIKIAISKKKIIPLKDITEFKSYKGGLSVQALHIGDYKEMNATLRKMKEYAKEKGYNTENDTHDIYLNDVRKTKKENLKTIMFIRIKK